MAGGGMGMGQNIGGTMYTPYTPQWYAAMQADENARAGRGGTNAGTSQANEINQVSPAVQGLLNAVGGSSNNSSGGGGGLSLNSGDITLGGGAGTPNGGGAPPANGGVPQINGGTPLADVAPVDQTAADAATFGKAKDQAGQTGRSAIDSMNGLLGATGQLGSGAQVQGTRDVVENAASGVNDVTRANAVNTAQSDLDVAKTNQATKLTERGQDISAQQAQAQLAMEQAQLNSQRQLAMLQQILGFSGGATPPPSQY